MDNQQIHIFQKECIPWLELKYEIVKSLGVLSQSPSGWTKELNLAQLERPGAEIRYFANGRQMHTKGQGRDHVGG